MLVARRNSKPRATKLRNPERARERFAAGGIPRGLSIGVSKCQPGHYSGAAGVTKGALYYPFESKETLEYAVIEEIIGPNLRPMWLRPLQRGKDPIDALIEIVQGISVRPKDVRGGCELNNLNQEMSPLDAGFRKRIAILFPA